MKAAPKLEYGKHAYAPNVKTESIKSIKILPPLVLRPIPSIAKEIVTVYRTKRSANNLTTSENITDVENGTVPSVKIDQVTQAITVTQISGTPPSTNNKEVTPPLNFQPFSITSSDFKNNSGIVNSAEVDEDIEVAKLISDKLKEVTSDFDAEDEYATKRANNSKEKEDVVRDAYKEDEVENNKQINQNEEHEESGENNEQKYQNTEEAEIEDKAENKPAEKSLIINVPEPTLNNQENPQNIQESSYEDEKIKKEEIEEFPAIDEFLKHIIPSEFEDDSNENKQEIRKPSSTEQKSNLDFSIEFQDKEKDKVQEEKSIFDDFLSEQKEINDKLRGELEYPDLDNDYEKYRQDALSSYIGTKEYNFETASKPYEINLEGYYPHEKHLQEKEDVQDNGNDKEKNVQNEYRDDEDEREEIQNEDVQDNGNDKEKNVQNEYRDDEDEREDIQNENDEESSETKYTYWPFNKEESKITETKSEQNEPKKYSETPGNVIQELNTILGKKNAISRQQEISNPEQYNTFWSLKYKVPKH